MRFVLSGGGTAGHINPALALADQLLERGHEVLYAGTPAGIESRLVPAAGISYKAFEAAGFNRNHPMTLPKSVLKIQKSTKLARAWFEEVKPDCVVGFGGYVCIPVARAAEQRGIPVVVHEQNSVMVWQTNTWLVAQRPCALRTSTPLMRFPTKAAWCSRATPCVQACSPPRAKRVVPRSAFPPMRACCLSPAAA